MPATDAPTSPRGILGGNGYLSGWGGSFDQLEHVQDLQWPLSVRTYARMRHDPTITSVLSAYRLPIISARWEIDPRGASPRMVQVCADSLGLPVRGQPDDPGPVRRRGVQWLAHLRGALGMLTFGHAVYEPTYDVSTGTALLASLGERLPLSIAEIEVTDQGNLKSITQYGDITKPSPPPIPADLLLWYVLDREGANWAGNSMLRACFGSWLLKQDALRVGGTSLRRFGAGTPSVEWDKDAHPTADQHRAALAAASNARVGDSGAVAMPPGAQLRIRGVEGSYPDAIPQVRYHDEQMARSALASMLDLGSTANGSRALGQSFAELLGLAQQGLADQLAETASQVCVRLTDFNEGEDAPAPAVAVGAIGDDEQALAQSIAQLISVGAVTADDDLEAWFRQVFRAPDRGTPRPKPTPPPAPPADPATDPTGQPPAPVTARRVRAADAVQTDPAPADPPAMRELTPQEQAAGLDPQEVDDEHGLLSAALLAAWLLLRRRQRAALVEQVQTLLTDGGIEALAGLSLPTDQAATVLADWMGQAAESGVRLATAEAARQGVTITGATVDTAAITATATALAAALGQASTAAAAQQAIALAASGMPAADVAAGVADYLGTLPDRWTEDQMSAAVQTGMGAGRAATYEAGPAATFFASEVLDRATCRQIPPDPVPRCWETDGTQYATLTAALEQYPSGRYRACKGGPRCRGMILAVYDGGES